MRKPKYYLKPYWMCRTTYSIPKDNWERARLRNEKPEEIMENQSNGIRRFTVKGGYGTWTFHNDTMTQRFFIEEKEAQND